MINKIIWGKPLGLPRGLLILGFKKFADYKDQYTILCEF
jgi:hypothetical protein